MWEFCLSCTVAPCNSRSSACQPLEIGLLKNRYGPKGWLEEQNFLFRRAQQRIDEIATDHQAESEDELFGRDP